MTRPDLHAAALLITELGGTIVDWPDDDMGGAALRYADGGYEVFPLVGKVPAIKGGAGVLDATCDLAQIVEWWTRFPQANIGGRVPAGVAVVDIDPQHQGDVTWKGLEAEHGLALTRTVISGRAETSRHLYFRHPGGRLRGTIGQGLDVKTSAGYTVLPPSVHPTTGRSYRWADPTAPICAAPAWLVDLLRQPPAVVPTSRPSSTSDGDSIADWFSATRTWSDVLGPHGWALVAGGGDDDGSRWRHPTATQTWSATCRHNCLFVYSPNTPLEQTDAQAPHGYTRFRAFAVLDHHGDLSAAARAARTMRTAA